MELVLPALLTGKAAAVFAWLALFFAAERWRPAAKPPDQPAARPAGGQSRLGRNLALWLANVALSLLVVVPLTAGAAALAPGWRPAWWQGAPGLVADLVLLDFFIYWWHRWNHEIPFLWRFHEIHHLDRTLDTTTALRFHFGEVTLSALARAAAIVVLALPLSSVLVFETAVLMAAIFHHSNLRLPAAFERALARLIITPSLHWVHHHARRSDTDSNYATVLSVWDRLFATRSPTARRLDMPIGVEGQSERPLIDLLARPFRHRA
jgi:sterol desaturase/sphingolipid hydroxylase (fatty acid hydroxylase superfamily)